MGHRTGFTLVLMLALGARSPASAGHRPVETEVWPPSEEERALAEKFAAEVSPLRLRGFLQALTAQPHPPGSPGDRQVEEYIYAQLKSFGLDPQWDEYEALISAHVSSHLEMTHPQREALSLFEDEVAGDPFSKRTGEFPAWHAYGASGEAEGEVVYANFGRESDFARLKAMGVDLKGKIVLVRQYEGGRGGKILRAQQAGAVGALLFSDPLDDGYVWGDVYPKGPWRPLSGIQRGSVESSAIPGDPQTPGWPSRPGARRLPVDQLEGLPRIPSLPISAREAGKILGRMAGPAVPRSWGGALGFTYRTGPGPVRVLMRTRNRLEVKPIRNILALVSGRLFPDQHVMMGNHHDAHLFGAGDPNSGTAVQLEYARILGGWLRQGWRPQRSILIASWCAEEYGLVGATEWVEDHAEAVRDKVVVHLNSDSAVFNVDTPLWVGASPTLVAIIQQTSSRLRDPRSGRPFDQVWLQQQRDYSGLFSSMGESWQILPGEEGRTRPKIDPNAGTDDNTAFYYHLVVPGTDMFYGTDYGMYHSVYENFHWMSEVIDPGFHYHALMTKILGWLALRMADGDYIPLDYVHYARRLQAALARLERRLPPAFRADFAGLADRAREWEVAAAQAQERLAQRPRLDAPLRGQLNALWYRLERAFYRKEGLPGSPWYKNIFAGPVVGVPSEGEELPALQYALGKNDLALWKEQTAVYREVLDRLVAQTRQVMNMMHAKDSARGGAHGG